jgi:hypothetical protein
MMFNGFSLCIVRVNQITSHIISQICWYYFSSYGNQEWINIKHGMEILFKFLMRKRLDKTYTDKKKNECSLFCLGMKDKKTITTYHFIPKKFFIHFLIYHFLLLFECVM